MIINHVKLKVNQKNNHYNIFFIVNNLTIPNFSDIINASGKNKLII